MRVPNWLNVGCGTIFAPEPWVNVDSCAQVEPDLVGSITALPVPDNSVGWIYAGHVYEHLTFPDEVSAALVEARRVLRADGHMCIVAPDLDRIDRSKYPHLYKLNVEGAKRWPGDEHRWECRERILYPLVTMVFPDAVSVPIERLHNGWPVHNREPWQLCILT